MSVESPKDVVQAVYENAWNGKDLEGARQLLHPDLIDHNPLSFPGRPAGAEGLLAVVATIRGAFPDLERTIDDQLAEGEKVVTRFTDRGTHQGTLMGIPPTGRQVEVSGINIEVVRNGRITEIWHVEDLAGLMQQLGVG